MLSAATDVGVFADRVLGAPLWDHQLAFVRSSAMFRCVVAGRQVGKSRALAAMSLYEATTRAGVLVLVVSAGEEAAKRVLAECSTLASRSDLLRGSIVKDDKNLLAFTNGSAIRSVPASEKQIRGWAVDLLIVDEAAFIPNEIWNATLPVIISRPGARVVCTSTPWGASTHWFRELWRRGMDRSDDQYESWQWSSFDSPAANVEFLEELRRTKTAEYFLTEVMGEFLGDSGSFFSESELESCVADYHMCPPEDLEWWHDHRFAAAAGVDWGFAQDANALCLVSVMDDHGLNRSVMGDALPVFVPWFEYKFHWPYSQFIDRVVQVAGRYELPVVVSETNGVGQYPTTMLDERMAEAGHAATVAPVVTDVRRKQSGFGMIKGLLQARRLVLPREPELLKQLRNLEFEQLTGGNVRISVPTHIGHDDVAMSFMQAMSALWMPGAVRGDAGFGRPTVTVDTVSTSGGVVVPVEPRPVAFHRQAFGWPSGSEQREVW